MKLCNDLHYLHMSRIILPLERTLGVRLLCYNGILGQMLKCSDFNIFVFLFMLM